MLDFSSIAVFILATTAHHQKQSYLDTRIIPIFRTWGFHFGNLFFVFGTNSFDWDYINEHCLLISGKNTTSNHRKLVAHTKQVPLQHKVELYRCYFHNKYKIAEENTSIIKNNESIHKVSSFQVLWTANCTGIYNTLF